MDTSRIFMCELGIACAITSWGALKQGYAPWPPVIVAQCVAFGILSGVAVFDDEIAVLLGGGFLLALLVGASSSASSGGSTSSFAQNFAALPQNVSYDTLKFGSAGSSSGGNSNG
jgi:hypothetical protein